MNPSDERLLRAAITLSAQARRAGNQPYGALLADAQGRVLLEAGNTQVTTGDCTGHAELNLVRDASTRFDRAQLATCTVYASGEPCPMCAGAIYWAGVRRLVFGLSIETMTTLAGPGADELALPCAEVLARGAQRVEVLGPALEDEARRVFDAPQGCAKT
ncbi:MAG: nucleoside deaminase [Pseudomonadota bacterium]